MNEAASLLTQLSAIVGDEHFLTGADAVPFSTDVYRTLATPAAVLRPTTVDAVQDLMRTLASHGKTVTVRGGGASYTDGYLQRDDSGVIIDLSGLDAIVEINEQDCYVTVEAGVTWAALSDALAPLGWRTPFRGPFSGLHATVGGSMAQNAISHGSGGYGISAESVLSFDVVTADGELLQTGAAAAGLAPATRHFGPDLTGLFTGDCGALGLKVRVTLPLLRARPAHRVASFAFPDFESMHKAMALIARERLEESQFALDQALSQGQIARQDNAGDHLKLAWSILRSSPSLLSGLGQLLRATRARSTIDNAAFMSHYIVEGVDDGEARSRLHRLRELVLGHGQEVEATVPAVVRGMPFAPFFNTLGPAGERWVPLHGVLPHSQVAAFHDALQELYAQRKDDLESHGVWTGGMFATVGSSSFLYEIAIYWPDEITDYHRSVVPADYLQQLPVYEANPEARACVDRLKCDLADLYAKHGATNFQIGRFYPFADRLQEPAAKLLRAVKSELDPNWRLSQGVLGLEQEPPAH